LFASFKYYGFVLWGRVIHINNIKKYFWFIFDWPIRSLHSENSRLRLFPFMWSMIIFWKFQTTSFLIKEVIFLHTLLVAYCYLGNLNALSANLKFSWFEHLTIVHLKTNQSLITSFSTKNFVNSCSLLKFELKNFI
jgi:hypothetical protein